MHAHCHPSEWNFQQQHLGERKHPRCRLRTWEPSTCCCQWCGGPFSPEHLFPPNHDWAPAKQIMFCHTKWSKTLIWHSPYPSTSIGKSTQNLDSSVNRTGAQSFWVQVTWSCAHGKRICTWYQVNGTRIAGRLDLSPASCNRFLMVWVLMRTPVAFWKSLRNVVVLSNQWRRALTTRNRSWTSLVERSRPQHANA